MPRCFCQIYTHNNLTLSGDGIPLRRRSKHGILNLSWGSMGSGVPSGLQNQYEELRAS